MKVFSLVELRQKEAKDLKQQTMEQWHQVLWMDRKQTSQLLAESFERLGDPKALRVRYCAEWLTFSVCPGHEKRLLHANLCKARLCPICSWNRSRKLFGQLKDVLHLAVDRRPIRFLFLTLTARNVPSFELSSQIDRLFQAWHRFSRRKWFRAIALGWFRVLECTYNLQKGTYHPHFHVLLAVIPSYFSKHYVRQEQWVGYWQDALRVDYTPVVDIRTVREKAKCQSLEGVAAEAGKYAVKSADYLIPGRPEETDRIVQALDRAMKGRRLVTYGGWLRELHREIREGSNNRSFDACKCSICQSDMLQEVYRWNAGLKGYQLEHQISGPLSPVVSCNRL